MVEHLRLGFAGGGAGVGIGGRGTSEAEELAFASRGGAVERVSETAGILGRRERRKGGAWPWLLGLRISR